MSIVNVLRSYASYNISYEIINIKDDIYEVFELIGILDMFPRNTFQRNRE